MKKLLILLPFTFIACSTVEPNKTEVQTTVQPISIETEAPVSVENNLNDLNAMTFGCPKEALNIAAREAKKAPSQGSYQFSYFRISSSSHHAQYEIHFKSNVFDEPDLKYCVSIYCQQGWDPKTSKVTVKLMSDIESHNGDSKTTTHESSCGHVTPLRTVTKKARHKR